MRKLLPTAAAAMMLTLVLAGCAGSAEPDPSASGEAPPPAAATPSASAAPSASPTGDASGGQDGSGSGGSRCLTDDLAGSVETDEGGGAAGSYGVRLVYTNEGDAACSLQGWAGVSLVGGGDGSQLGVPATQNRTEQYVNATVEIEPGGTAYSPLMVTQALDYSNADCQPRDADGYRVYPPGNEESLFIEAGDVVGCLTDIELLDVGPVQQG